MQVGESAVLSVVFWAFRINPTDPCFALSPSFIPCPKVTIVFNLRKWDIFSLADLLQLAPQPTALSSLVAPVSGVAMIYDDVCLLAAVSSSSSSSSSSSNT